MNAPLPRCYADTPADSPWHEARARFGLAMVIRVIDLATGSDTFRPIANARDVLADDSEYFLDGTTLILPPLSSDAAPSPEESAAIIRRFDEAWRARRRPETPSR